MRVWGTRIANSTSFELWLPPNTRGNQMLIVCTSTCPNRLCPRKTITTPPKIQKHWRSSVDQELVSQQYDHTQQCLGISHPYLVPLSPICVRLICCQARLGSLPSLRTCYSMPIILYLEGEQGAHVDAHTLTPQYTSAMCLRSLLHADIRAEKGY